MRLASTLPLLALLAGLAPAAAAQGQIDRDHVPSDERVDLLERRSTDADGNVLRATVFNIGQTGRTAAVPGEIPYEWPKNTRRYYIALTGLFFGAEVENADGNTAYIVNVPNYREDPDDPNQAWTWAPVSGYVRPGEDANGDVYGIARSDNPQSWPPLWPDKREDPNDPGWPGSWSGYFGKDVFNADLEIYYKMGDDQYDRVAYFPDSTDLTRRGLGLVADVRTLAWSQVLIQDALFQLYAVKNDGTRDIRRAGVTLWLADLVGGDPQDDLPFFSLLLDTSFMTDRDGRGNEAFGNAPVGGAIAFFLETPGNAVDRIDNDGDGSVTPEAFAINGYGVSAGEPGSPLVTEAMLADECPANLPPNQVPPPTCFDGVDNNGNGLIDENQAYIAIVIGGVDQPAVGYADYIDNDGDGEPGSPVVTQEMVALAASDRWQRWPPVPGPYQGQRVHLVGVGPEDVGLGFKDGIDNDDDCTLTAAPLDYLWEPGSPTVTQAMIDAAAGDAPFYRYAVPGTDVVLYDVRQDDLGKCYADGVDNDGDGAVDEGIDEGIDEMIDESRADGIDNDGDWRAALDDVGLDGSALSGDFGENDGVPTSGAGTDFPGESNIDVTDVSESDQIGITNAQSRPAGGISFQNVQDRFLFFNFLVPGLFAAEPTQTNADTDLFVSSGIFPLRAGQTERIAVAVIIGEVDYTRPPDDIEGRYSDLLRKRDNAQEAYEADYRFAQAPITPTVRAVAGDGYVTLYWDRAAEESFDTFIADLNQPGLEPRDFEGYRVYRSTDPSFLDARQITNAFGDVRFLRPIAQFDKINGIGGEGAARFHPIAVDGTQFDLGTDRVDPGEPPDGLPHQWTDSTAVNGVTYYYAVTSYDFGATPAEISPSESAIQITVNPDGSVDQLGQNVAVVTPSQAAAGYVEAEIAAQRVQGFGTGDILFNVVDPTALEDGHRYRITFEDTLIVGTGPISTRIDTLTTKNFTLEDLTDGDTLVYRDTVVAEGLLLGEGADRPVIEGFQIELDAPRIALVDSSTAEDGRRATSWDDPAVLPPVVQRYVDLRSLGIRYPRDYRLVVGEEGSGQSTAFQVFFPLPTTLPSRPTNFQVFKRELNAAGQEVEVAVPYAIYDLTEAISGGGDPNPTGTGPAAFTADTTGQGESDLVILLEQVSGETRPTWSIALSTIRSTFPPNARNPRPGDELRIRTRKPFLSEDVYEFTVQGARLDPEAARNALDDIRVVPNPYIATNRFEPVNPFSSGRGERVIRFVGLPPQCTVRIFTVSGRLVRTLRVDNGTNEGYSVDDLIANEVRWDLLTEDRQQVSYGVYLYHVDAPGIGETTGTFAVIK